MAPPTRTPKGVYRWLNHSPIADAPPWLIERALSRRPLRVLDLRGSTIAPRPNRKPVSEGKLRDLMATIANDDATDWEEWNRIGLALFAATEGSDFGLELFHEWSEKHPDKYDFDKTLEKWQAFKTSPPVEQPNGSEIVNRPALRRPTAEGPRKGERE